LRCHSGRGRCQHTQPQDAAVLAKHGANDSDAIAPSTDIAMVSAVRGGTVGRLDVAPVLDLELTLGIVERSGRTRVPAAERAFELVRSYFVSVAQEVALHLPPNRKARRTRMKGKNPQTER
jgi:hypothetical protein